MASRRTECADGTNRRAGLVFFFKVAIAPELDLVFHLGFAFGSFFSGDLGDHGERVDFTTEYQLASTDTEEEPNDYTPRPVLAYAVQEGDQGD